MGWINAFLASDVAAVATRADPRDETLVNGAPPYDGHKAIRPSEEIPAVCPDAKISEDVKRRQLALMSRYLATFRAP